MGAIDQRLGVDGRDLLSRISDDERRTVQRHRAGVLRSGRAHHRRAVVQRDGHMRRSIRVGRRAGSPLEEFGVAPDALHLMTERDVLEDNRDLMACAARLIRQQPSFKLSVTPAGRKGARGIVVSAASKVPSSKASQAISRVDVYVNNRPVRSIDAKKGSVPSTEIALGKEHKKNAIVEVEALN